MPRVCYNPALDTVYIKNGQWHFGEWLNQSPITSVKYLAVPADSFSGSQYWDIGGEGHLADNERDRVHQDIQNRAARLSESVTEKLILILGDEFGGSYPSRYFLDTFASRDESQPPFDGKDNRIGVTSEAFNLRYSHRHPRWMIAPVSLANWIIRTFKELEESIPELKVPELLHKFVVRASSEFPNSRKIE